MDELEEFVKDIDAAIEPRLLTMMPANVAAVLLSRVTHLLAEDAETGLMLLKHVQDQLEQIRDSGVENWL
jgi:hypothetical protein